MKKILLLGSGFLSSNFVRYILYFSREFKITTISKFSDYKNYKHVYQHKNHKIHIGDVFDKEFVKKIIKIEEPEVIIDFTANSNKIYGNALGKGYLFSDLSLKLHNINYYGQNVHYIMLAPASEKAFDVCYDFNHGNTTFIRLPNVFGRREKCKNAALMPMIKTPEHFLKLGDQKIPWVYAEDVASYIWYLIENKIYGMVNMPILGKISYFEIGNLIKDIFDLSHTIKIEKDFKKLYLCSSYKSIQSNWKSDHVDLKSILNKTIIWYKSNKWSYNIY